MKGFVDHYKVTEVLKLERKDNHKIIAEQSQLFIEGIKKPVG